VKHCGNCDKKTKLPDDCWCNVLDYFSDIPDIPVRCLHHSFTVHTHYEVASPYPPFFPLISMACPGVAVFNTGDSLIVLDVRVDKTVDDSSHGLQFSGLCSVSDEVNADDDDAADDGNGETAAVSESIFLPSTPTSSPSPLFSLSATEEQATPKDATNTPPAKPQVSRERSLSSGKENQLLVFPVESAGGSADSSESACSSGIGGISPCQCGDVYCIKCWQMSETNAASVRPARSTTSAAMKQNSSLSPASLNVGTYQTSSSCSSLNSPPVTSQNVTQCFTYSVRRYSSAVSHADTEGNY